MEISSDGDESEHEKESEEVKNQKKTCDKRTRSKSMSEATSDDNLEKTDSLNPNKEEALSAARLLDSQDQKKNSKPPMKKPHRTLSMEDLTATTASAQPGASTQYFHNKPQVGTGLIPQLGSLKIAHIQKVNLDAWAIENYDNGVTVIPERDQRWTKFVCAIIVYKGKLGMFEGELTNDYKNMIGSILYKYCGRSSEARDVDNKNDRNTLFAMLPKEIKYAWKGVETLDDKSKERYISDFIQYYNAKVSRNKKEKKLAKEASSSRLKPK